MPGRARDFARGFAARSGGARTLPISTRKSVSLRLHSATVTESFRMRPAGRESADRHAAEPLLSTTELFARRRARAPQAGRQACGLVQRGGGWVGSSRAGVGLAECGQRGRGERAAGLPEWISFMPASWRPRFSAIISLAAPICTKREGGRGWRRIRLGRPRFLRHSVRPAPPRRMAPSPRPRTPREARGGTASAAAKLGIPWMWARSPL